MISFHDKNPIEHISLGAAGYSISPSVFIKEDKLVYRLGGFDTAVTMLGLVPALGAALSVICFLRDTFKKDKIEFAESPLKEDLEAAKFSIDINNIKKIECTSQSSLYGGFLRAVSFFPIINLFTFFYYESRATVHLNDGKKFKISFMSGDGASDMAGQLKQMNGQIDVEKTDKSLFNGLIKIFSLGWIPLLMLYAFFDPLLVYTGVAEKSIIEKQDWSGEGTLALFIFGFYLPIVIKIFKAFTSRKAPAI
jgi:hypothetical protein